MKFSIIIPVYNVENYLERCIKSALQQDCKETEIILINDGSTDGSLEICEKYKNKYDNIIIISQENQGVSSSRNKGIINAKGDYIVFLDSDDWLVESSLDQVYEHMADNDLEMLTLSQCIYSVEEKCVEYRKPFIPKLNLVMSGIGYIEEYGRNYPTTVWSYVYKRTFLIKNEIYFAEGLFHEDSEFMTRAFLSVGKIGFKDIVFYNHFYSEHSIMRSRNIKKCFDLVEISQMVHFHATKVNNKSENVAKKIHEYGADLSYAAIKSCILQKYELKQLLGRKKIREVILKSMKARSRYWIVRVLLAFHLNNLIKLLIIINEKKYLVKNK